MYLKTEENLCEALRSIQTPTLMIGGTQDPISTMELMTRTASCLPHCKLVIYSNCGHDIDTDLIEETCDEADRKLKALACMHRHEPYNIIAFSYGAGLSVVEYSKYGDVVDPHCSTLFRTIQHCSTPFSISLC